MATRRNAAERGWPMGVEAALRGPGIPRIRVGLPAGSGGWTAVLESVHGMLARSIRPGAVVRLGASLRSGHLQWSAT